MNRLDSIGEASKALGVSITTLRRWEVEGRLMSGHTAGGHRRYDLAKLKPKAYRSVVHTRQTVAYARVSSSGQKEALNRQQQALELYYTQQGWSFSDYP